MTTSTSAPSPSPDKPLFVGIDVAKDKLDLATSHGERVQTFDNDPAGHRRIVDLLVVANAKQKPACIVVESTGGYEWPLVQALLEADLPVAHVNPTYVRHLAIGLKILAKTDPIDARVLVRYAQLAEPVLLERCTKNQAELAALVTCRRQLQQTLTQQTNRRAMTRSTAAIKAIDKVVKALEHQIAELDAAIRELIDSDDHFNDLDRLLRTVPGIGPVASATLVAQMPELAGQDRPPPGPGAARRRPVQPRLREAPGPALDLRRTGRAPLRHLHGHARGHPLQPAHQSIRRAAAWQGQEGQGGHRRLHAKAHHPDQRHDPRPTRVEPARRREKLRRKPLTFNTAALR